MDFSIVGRLDFSDRAGRPTTAPNPKPSTHEAPQAAYGTRRERTQVG